MSDISYFAGTIIPWVTDWVPKGWLPCDGRYYPTNQHDNPYFVLFIAIGTTYGSARDQSGNVLFRVPDLRGRVAVAADPVNRPLKTSGGQKSMPLGIGHLPSHNHSPGQVALPAQKIPFTGSLADGACEIDVKLPNNASDQIGNLVSTPTSNTTLGVPTAGVQPVRAYSTNDPNVSLAKSTVTATGQAQGGYDDQVTVNVQPGGFTVGTAGNGRLPVPLVQPYVALNFIINYDGQFPQRS